MQQHNPDLRYTINDKETSYTHGKPPNPHLLHQEENGKMYQYVTLLPPGKLWMVLHPRGLHIRESLGISKARRPREPAWAVEKSPKGVPPSGHALRLTEHSPEVEDLGQSKVSKSTNALYQPIQVL